MAVRSRGAACARGCRNSPSHICFALNTHLDRQHDTALGAINVGDSLTRPRAPRAGRQSSASVGCEWWVSLARGLASSRTGRRRWPRRRARGAKGSRPTRPEWRQQRGRRARAASGARAKSSRRRGCAQPRPALSRRQFGWPCRCTTPGRLSRPESTGFERAPLLSTGQCKGQCKGQVQGAVQGAGARGSARVGMPRTHRSKLRTPCEAVRVDREDHRPRHGLGAQNETEAEGG